MKTYFLSIVKSTLMGILTFAVSSMEAKNILTPSQVATNPQISQPFPHPMLSITDPQFSSGYSGTVNQNIYNKVQVYIDRKDKRWIKTTGTITIQLEVVGLTLDAMGNINPFNSGVKTVELTFDTSLSAKETDVVSLVFPNVVKSNVIIHSVTIMAGGLPIFIPPAGLTGVPNYEIVNEISVDRYIALATGTPNNIKIQAINNGEKLKMSWNMFDGAEEYQLEYIFINDPGTISGSFNYGTNTFDPYNCDYNFRHNCTRISIKDLSFEIPNIFPRGFILFRIRPVGLDLNDITKRTFGDWNIPQEATSISVASLAIGMNPLAYFSNNRMQYYNWSSEIGFVEDGVNGGVRTYYDGTMRAREAVTYSNSTGQYTVAQTIYDYLGREALVAMPAVALDNAGYDYRANFNTDASGGEYTYEDFDFNNTSATSPLDKEIEVSAMGSNSGAAKFYSAALKSTTYYASQNVNTQRMHDFIPNSLGYPFSQVEFSRDPSGRTLRQGGVGKTHQLKHFDPATGNLVDGKETKIWDGTPTQMELDILFGNEVGDSRKYKKVMTQDPNGQISVAYIDPYGRTIATSLAGGPNNTPNLDPLSNSSHGYTIRANVKNTIANPQTGEKSVISEFLIPNTTEFKIWYTLDRPQYGLCDPDLCIDCAYDLTVSLVDTRNGNKEMIPGGPITTFVGNPTIDTFSCDGTQSFAINPNPIKVNLETGSYTLIKKLTINRDRQEALKRQWIARANCVKPFSDFLNEELLLAAIDCDFDCDDCDAGLENIQHRIDSITTYCTANSITLETHIGYIDLQKEEKDFHSICDEMCQPKTPCDILYDAMTIDIQPGGQYAEYMTIAVDDNGNETEGDLSAVTRKSIFKPIGDGLFMDNCITTNNISAGTAEDLWRQPKLYDVSTGVYESSEYLTEDGEEFRIPVQIINGVNTPATNNAKVDASGASYTLPSDLTQVTDFVEYYKNNLHWAKQLVIYHPEYCTYQECTKFNATFKYDLDMLSVSSAKLATEYGLYDPMNMEAETAEGGLGEWTTPGTTYKNDITYSQYEDALEVEKDPLLTILSGLNPGSSEYNYWNNFLTEFKTILRENKIAKNGNTSNDCNQNVPQTIWEFMEKLRLEKQLTTLDECVDDYYWFILRNLYINAKFQAIDKYIHRPDPNGCGVNQCITESNQTRRWKIDAIGDMLSSASGKMPKALGDWFKNPANITGACNTDFDSDIESHTASHCETICESNADAWMKKFEACFEEKFPLFGLTTQSQIDNKKADIRADFIKMCKGGCDLDAPYGSINISPASMGKTENGNLVYEHTSIDHILATHFGVNYFSVGVCDDLIINFPGEYGHDYQAYNGPNAEDCACDKNKNIRKDINSKCPEYGHDSLKLDDCVCYKTGDLKKQALAMKNLSIDQKCQNCITCKEMQKPLEDFLERYDITQYTSATDTLLIQDLLKNWLNRKFGFNLLYSDYEKYILECLPGNIYVNWYDKWLKASEERLVQTTPKINELNPYYSPWAYDSYASMPTSSVGTDQYKANRGNAFFENKENYWTSTNNTWAMPPMPNTLNNTATQIECHCKKILTAQKRVQDGSSTANHWGMEYMNLYGPPPVGVHMTQMEDLCCELMAEGKDLNGPWICPDDWDYGEGFAQEGLDLENEKLSQNDPTATALNIPDNPCDEPSVDLTPTAVDDCACKKIKGFHDDWSNDPQYGPGMPNELTYEDYLQTVHGASSPDIDKVLDYCTKAFYTGVDRDKNDNPAETFSGSSNFNTTSKANLQQYVEDFDLKLPRELGCGPPPLPCHNDLSCHTLKTIFFNSIIAKWGEVIGPGSKTRGELMEIEPKKDKADHHGQVMKWLSGDPDNGIPALSNFMDPYSNIFWLTPAEQQRVLWLRSLLNDFKLLLQCPSPPKADPSTFTLEFFLRGIMGCLYPTIQEPRCAIGITDCAEFGSYVRQLAIDGVTPPSGSVFDVAGYENAYSEENYKYFYKDFNDWYVQYKSKKINGNQTAEEDAWATALLDKLNQDKSVNRCSPDVKFTMEELLGNLFRCFWPEFPTIEPTPCPDCYSPNQAWLDDFAAFLNQVTTKQVQLNCKIKPDLLTNKQFYLKPNSSKPAIRYMTTFYDNNSSLYSGTDEGNLQWKLDVAESPDMMPEMTVSVVDNSGYKLKFRLRWPSDDPRWNFRLIEGFELAEAVSTKDCGAPRFFNITARYRMPDKYWKDGNGNPIAPYLDCPNFPSGPGLTGYTCDVKIKLIGEIVEYTENGGLSIAKSEPCLGCNFLCNRPFGLPAVEESDCEQEAKLGAVENARIRYKAYIAEKEAEFDRIYNSTCFAATESLDVEYYQNQYHHTLYYYDQAGQLIKTVPPSGIDIDNEIISANDRQALANDRATTALNHRADNNNPKANIYHSLITQYRYNTAGELIWQNTPDGGESRFWYDNLGRLIISQNAKQKPVDKYSYTKYDDLGRAIEAGEMTAQTSTHVWDVLHARFDEGNTVVSNSVNWNESTWQGSVDMNISITNVGLDKGLTFTPHDYDPILIPQYTSGSMSMAGLTPELLYNLDFYTNFPSGTGIQMKYLMSTNGGTTALGDPNGYNISNGQIVTTLILPSGSDGSLKIEYRIYSENAAHTLTIRNLHLRHNKTQLWKPNARYAATPNWVTDWQSGTAKEEVVKSYYDEAPNTSTTNNAFGGTQWQSNLRNRVAAAEYYTEYDQNNPNIHYQHTQLYSYDIHGNADKIAQYIPALDRDNLGRAFFTLEYDYDLLSGKVHSVDYQKGKADDWRHRYEYDADNRLKQIFTSRDGVNWENDAEYFYYVHGPLARTELGENKVQGVDYAYNLQGWIKGVNGPNMEPDNDIGWDGALNVGANANRHVARDAFAYYLSYYNGDYTDLNMQNSMEPSKTGSDLEHNYRGLYNGNIAHMGTFVPKNKGINSWAGLQNTPLSRKLTPSAMGNIYHYDQLNRITKHFTYTNFQATPGYNGLWQKTWESGMDKYYEDFSYDANGNIKELNRNAGTQSTGSAPSYNMDQMNYKFRYETKTITYQQNATNLTLPSCLLDNRLYHVQDLIADNSFEGDIDDQGFFNSGAIQTANNYEYDALGNLIKDVAEGIDEIKWNVSGKIQSITRSNLSLKPDLRFGYDFAGQRLYKIVIPKEQTGPNAGQKLTEEHWKQTWYIKDASGNNMATYETKYKREPAGSNALIREFVINELYIYGSKRHGVLKPNETITSQFIEWTQWDYDPDGLISESVAVLQQTDKTVPTEEFKLIRGCKSYELSNHLGNVLVTIQDRKWGMQTSNPANANLADYYLPYIQTITDYYAFGSSMTDRTTSYSEGYSFGFNGKEKEDGIGDGYDFGARIYDSRLGRWLSTDKYEKTYTSFSPYNFVLNAPIKNIDPNGHWVKTTVKKFYRGKDGELHRKSKISLRKTVHKEYNIKIHNMKVVFDNAIQITEKYYEDYIDENGDPQKALRLRKRGLNQEEKKTAVAQIKQQLENTYSGNVVKNKSGKKSVSVKVEFANDIKIIKSQNKAKMFSLSGKVDDVINVKSCIECTTSISAIGLSLSRNLMHVDYAEIARGDVVPHEFAHQRKMSAARILTGNNGGTIDHNHGGVFTGDEPNFENLWRFNKRNTVINH